MVHTYVINLERAVDRRAWMEKQLSGSGLDYELVRGVEGANLSAQDRAELVDEEASKPPWSLRNEQIGCCLSHWSVYRRIAERGDEGASLVLEDDTILAPDIAEVTEAVAEAIGPKEIVLLHYLAIGRVVLSEDQSVRVGSRRLLRPVDARQRLLSGAAYMIGYEAARSLADAVIPIRVNADQWEHQYNAGALAGIRCVFPRPVTGAVAFESSVGYRNGRYRWVPARLRRLNRRRMVWQMGRVRLTSAPASVLTSEPVTALTSEPVTAVRQQHFATKSPSS